MIYHKYLPHKSDGPAYQNFDNFRWAEKQPQGNNAAAANFIKSSNSTQITEYVMTPNSHFISIQRKSKKNTNSPREKRIPVLPKKLFEVN